ncbi:Hypothetical_protein [Hexamita inflata]|uniref:Hypothetical_protein n=1 Tax=Hexamita inflata TaxID=28002 RepID=A0AA86P5H0_9EUKA|nr:Hypothetical protein HINF_LOCUS18292 [Hexamita inflata]
MQLQPSNNRQQEHTIIANKTIIVQICKQFIKQMYILKNGECTQYFRIIVFNHSSRDKNSNIQGIQKFQVTETKELEMQNAFRCCNFMMIPQVFTRISWEPVDKVLWDGLMKLV